MQRLDPQKAKVQALNKYEESAREGIKSLQQAIPKASYQLHLDKFWNKYHHAKYKVPKNGIWGKASLRPFMKVLNQISCKKQSTKTGGLLCGLGLIIWS